MAKEQKKGLFEVTEDVSFEGKFKSLPTVHPAIYIASLHSIAVGSKNVYNTDDYVDVLEYNFKLHGVVDAIRPEIVNSEYLKTHPAVIKQQGEPQPDKYMSRFQYAGAILKAAGAKEADIKARLTDITANASTWKEWCEGVSVYAKEVVAANKAVQFKLKVTGSVYQGSPTSKVTDFFPAAVPMSGVLNFSGSDRKDANNYFNALSQGGSGSSGGSTTGGNGGDEDSELPF